MNNFSYVVLHFTEKKKISIHAISKTLVGLFVYFFLNVFKHKSLLEGCINNNLASDYGIIFLKKIYRQYKCVNVCTRFISIALVKLGDSVFVKGLADYLEIFTKPGDEKTVKVRVQF